MASKITFIGAGNMAGAIIGGLIESGVSPSDITATAPNESELAPLKARLVFIPTPTTAQRLTVRMWSCWRSNRRSCAAFVKPCVKAFSSRRRW